MGPVFKNNMQSPHRPDTRVLDVAARVMFRVSHPHLLALDSRSPRQASHVEKQWTHFSAASTHPLEVHVAPII